MSKLELFLATMGLVARVKGLRDASLVIIASLVQSVTRRLWPDASEVCVCVKQNYLDRLKASTVVQQATARKQIAEARILETAATKAEIRLLREYEAFGTSMQKQTRPERRVLRNRTNR